MTPRYDYSRIVISVVWVMGGFIIANSIGYWSAVLLGIAVPEGATTLIGAGVGYMGGILTSTKGASDSQDVNATIVNPPSDPVPVSDESKGYIQP
jgi:hypothetical protein